MPAKSTAPRRISAAPSVAARMSALRDFAALDPEVRLNTTELGLLIGKSPEATRIDLRTGKLSIPLAPECRGDDERRGRMRFRLGDVRAALRGEVAA